MPDVAFILNEPTPYRLHLLRRLDTELRGVRLHPIFTHTVRNTSMPWHPESDITPAPVHFPELALAPGRLAPLRGTDLARRIAQHMTEYDVRLVILHGYADMARIQLARWAHGRGIPLLVRADSNVRGEHRLSWPKRAVKRRFIRWLIRRVSGLMPMGSCGEAFFRLYADHDKPTFRVPYEPDYDRLAQVDDAALEAARAQFGLDTGRRRLLFCGRLVTHKRADVLIDAFADRVAAARPDWDLVIAGDGPLAAALRARVPGSLGQRVRFTGFLQTPQLAACYHACDVLVHPSSYEPWGVIINEAVACGLAVVATEVTGAAVELVREGSNGLLVPPGDVGALGDALISVTDDARLAAMKAAAAPALAAWRETADPVAGFRAALDHFALSAEPLVEDPG